MKKQTIVTLVLLLVLAALLGAAVLVYPKLKDTVLQNVPPVNGASLVPGETVTVDVPRDTDPAGTNGTDGTDGADGADPAASGEGGGTAEEQRIVAPAFTVQNTDGETVSFPREGRPAVLNFWATWCPPCRAELPDYNEAAKTYGDRIDFWFVDLTDGDRETVDTVKEFMEENGYDFPVYFDTEYSGAIAYGVSSIPLSVFVSADGTVSDAYLGALSADVLESCIKALLPES